MIPLAFVEAVAEGHESAEHIPWLVEKLNAIAGPMVFDAQRALMPPVYHVFNAAWPGSEFSSGRDALAHGYLPIPTHVVMALLAFLLCSAGLWIARGKLSVESPSRVQHILEVMVNFLHESLTSIIGSYGKHYLAVIGSFTIFILVSNLMGQLPDTIPPTSNLNVTLALGVTSFLYYIYRGFRQQGVKYLMHFFGGLTGIVLFAIGPIIFIVEIISNCVRPMTLSLRLMVNMFADEQIGGAFSSMLSIGLPIPAMALGIFVALIQTFIFINLSMVYLSETVPHDDHSHAEEAHG